MQRLITICAVVCILSVGLTGIAHAEIITLSTTETETLGGIAFKDGSLVDYDTVAGIASLRFDEDEHFPNEDIDAVYLLDNGHYILSTQTGATLGGLPFRDGDLVDYDPVAKTALLFFNEDLFAADENIDAVHVLDNGHIILSTTSDASLGGTLIEPGDLVDFDPVTGTASLFLDRDLHFTSLGPNIDAVYVFDYDHIILSTIGATLGGLSFEKGDLVDYYLSSKDATMFLDADAVFASYHSLVTDIDAVHIPEPATVLLFGLGSMVLLRRRRAYRRQK